MVPEAQVSEAWCQRRSVRDAGCQARRRIGMRCQTRGKRRSVRDMVSAA
ncbi:MAG: hypothetical protein LBK25_02965 [Treponema sp.]|nr:hypothetical protein [Treponema sp.]